MHFHCFADILHILPIAVVFAAYFFGSFASFKSNVVAAASSGIAVLFGSIFHQTHSVMFFDPCYLYAAIFAATAFRAVRLALLKQRA